MQNFRLLKFQKRLRLVFQQQLIFSFFALSRRFIVFCQKDTQETRRFWVKIECWRPSREIRADHINEPFSFCPRIDT